MVKRSMASVATLLALSLPLGGCASPTASRSQQRNDQIILPGRVEGLDFPVAMVITPDGRFLITEKRGRIRLVKDGKLQEAPFLEVNVPQLEGYSETGLLGIALDPDYARNRLVYFYNSYEENGRIFNRVARVRDEGDKAGEPEVILDKIPGGRIHDGGIIAFGPDGNLAVATGETGEQTQDPNSLAGKTLRIKPDGSIPKDNPFPNSPVYSLGHRNIFGLAFNPANKQLYATENGPDGDDEVELIVAGGNYGWPEVQGPSADERFINPIKNYAVTIAPTQALFFNRDLFFATFVERSIHRLKLGDNGRTVERDDIVYTADEGINGITQAPDGSIYAILSDSIVKVDRPK